MDKHYNVNDLFRLVGVPHLMWQREHPGEPPPDDETVRAWSRDAFIEGVAQQEGDLIMLGKARLDRVVLANRRLDLFDAVMYRDSYLFRDAVAMADADVNRYFMERFDLRPTYQLITEFHKYPAMLGALIAGGYDINSQIPSDHESAEHDTLLWFAVKAGYSQASETVLYMALEAGAKPEPSMIEHLINAEISRVSTDVARDMVDYADDPLEFAKSALDHVNRIIAIGNSETADNELLNRFRIASETLMSFRAEVQQLLLNGYTQEARAGRSKATRAGRNGDHVNSLLSELAAEGDEAPADPFDGMLNDPFDDAFSGQAAYAPGL